MTEPNGAAAPDPVPETTSSEAKTSTPHSNRTGWDGKLRVNSEKQAVLANPEALEDSDYEDEDAPPVDEIAADEGSWTPYPACDGCQNTYSLAGTESSS